MRRSERAQCSDGLVSHNRTYKQHTVLFLCTKKSRLNLLVNLGGRENQLVGHFGVQLDSVYLASCAQDKIKTSQDS